MNLILLAPSDSGVNGTCSKCGHIGAATTCIELAGIGHGLTRTCHRCGFQWLERPVPTSPAVTLGYYA